MREIAWVSPTSSAHLPPLELFIQCFNFERELQREGVSADTLAKTMAIDPCFDSCRCYMDRP